MSTGPSHARAIVTGASSGIGRAIATALRAEGIEVHAVALPEPGLDELARETGAIAHPMDVRDTEAVERLVAGIEADVLVNNAGILGAYRPLQDFDREAVDRLVDINLRQAIHFTRAVLPGMIARRKGHLFFTGSAAARIPSPGFALYGATKAALFSFADALRWDILGSGVRTTVLIPGRVETNLYDGHFGGHGKAHEALYRGFDAIQPEDIARTVVFALAMPPHVDVTAMEVMPTRQVFGGSKTDK